MNAPDLKRFGLLAEFDDGDREALEGVLEERRLVPDEFLFREGDEASSLVLVVEGWLRLEARRVRHVEECGPGTCFGATSLVTVGPREASVTAIEEARVLCLDRSAFRRLVTDAPSTACRLLEAVIVDLAETLRPTLDRLGGVLADRDDPAEDVDPAPVDRTPTGD